MTVTMPEQRMVIDELKSQGLRQNVKVAVGGAPISEEWATEIGADVFANDAMTGVERIIAVLKK